MWYCIAYPAPVDSLTAVHIQATLMTMKLEVGERGGMREREVGREKRGKDKGGNGDGLDLNMYMYEY